MFFPGLRKGLRIVLAALDAGKHVYREWPLGRNLQEAEELATRPRLGHDHFGHDGSSRRPVWSNSPAKEGLK
jgi:hypothetical protein